MLGTFILYGSILIISTLLVFIYETEKNRALFLLFYIAAFLTVFIPAAIRYNIGTDYWSYIEIFYHIKNGKPTHVEFGYRYLNSFIASFSDNPELLVAFVSFITYFLFFISYPIKGSWVSHYLFITTIYLYTFSNFRTGIVLGIMTFAIIGYMYNRRISKYLFFVSLASTLHTASLIYLIIPFASSRKLLFIARSKVLSLFILATLFLIIIDKEIFSSIILLSSPLISSLGYYHYIDNSLFFDSAEISTGLGVVAKLLPLVLFIVLSSGNKNPSKELSLGINLSYLYILSTALALNAQIFARIEILFVPVYIIICHLALRYFSKVKYQLFIFIVISIFGILYFKNISSQRSDLCDGIRISPYVSIFNKQDDKSLGITRMECRSV